MVVLGTLLAGSCHQLHRLWPNYDDKWDTIEYCNIYNQYICSAIGPNRRIHVPKNVAYRPTVYKTGIVGINSAFHKLHKQLSLVLLHCT